MYADSTCQLGNACNRKFYFLASGHYEVTKLINNDNDVWQEFVPVIGVESALLELFVILLNITRASLLQQIVSSVHLGTKALQRLHDLVDVGNDRFFGILVPLDLSEKVVNDWIVNREFNLLGVDHN